VRLLAIDGLDQFVYINSLFLSVTSQKSRSLIVDFLRKFASSPQSCFLSSWMVMPEVYQIFSNGLVSQWLASELLY
jgi:hypothetical protein